MMIRFCLAGIMIFMLAISVSHVFKVKMCMAIGMAYSIAGFLIYVLMVFGLGEYSVIFVTVFIVMTSSALLFILPIINNCRKARLANAARCETPAIKFVREYKRIVCKSLVYCIKTCLFDDVGVLFWLICMLVLCFLYEGYGFVGGDEHSMWLTATKQMFYTNEITCTKTTNVSVSHYIPGKACVEYFFAKFVGIWDEPMMHRIISLWLISLGLPIFMDYRFNKTIASVADLVIRIIMCIGAPLLFTNAAYSMALCEPVLIGMGSFLLFALLEREHFRKLDYIWVAIMVASLASMKSAGTYIGLAIIAVCLLSRKEVELTNIVKIKVATIVAVSLTNGFWKMAQLRYSYEMVSPYKSTFSIKNLVRILTGKGTETELLVISNFVEAFIGKYKVWTVGKMPISNLLFLLMEIFICLYVCMMLSNIKRKNMVLSVFGSMLLYQVAILYVYLFVFVNTGEAVELGSYFRYSNIWNGTVIIGLLFTVYINTVKISGKTRLQKWADGVFWMVTAGVISMSLRYVKYAGCQWVYLREDAQHNYNMFSDVLNWKDELDENDRVYIVVNGDNGGFEYLYIKYLLCPIWVAPDYVSSDVHRFTYLTGDDFSKTRYFSLEDWGKELEGYTHVYLSSIDEGFETRYRNMFSDEPIAKQMYRIEYLDNHLSLVEAGN